MKRLGILAGAIVGVQVFMGAAAEGPLTLDIRDYLALPITGKLDGTGQTDGMLARVNAFREEPFDSRASGVAGGALAQDRPGTTKRFFLHDLNGPIYIFDTKSKALTVYLDLNGRNGRPGVFRKLSWEVGYANGLMSFQFDPDYRANGKFYTVHIEEPSVAASNLPDNTNFKGLNVAGYAATAPIVTPGPIQREGILVEWTDTNRSNATFEGTARELMRIQFNTRTHPLGDLQFNPAARRGDSEWRVLYLGCGDGAAGESSRPDTRNNPQRLDTMVGKILRIIPDLAEHQSSSVVSDNGRYRIPNDNPYVSTAGARKEIWASGFRNPHRLHWAIDPANPKNNRLIANSIGLHTWETVNIIQRGANYGYSLREGNEQLQFDNNTTKRPDVDRIPVQIGERILEETITPSYPVVQYPHKSGGGDAIGSGFVYQGKNIPALRGKYVFSDISTGRLWYVDYREMLAADDGNADTMAPMHEIALRWDDPNDTPDAGKQVYPTMFPIAQAAYHFRGGKDPDLPGRATVSGEGRADTQLAVDASGELYILTKSDGMIRTIVR